MLDQDHWQEQVLRQRKANFVAAGNDPAGTHECIRMSWGVCYLDRESNYHEVRFKAEPGTPEQDAEYAVWQKSVSGPYPYPLNR